MKTASHSATKAIHGFVLGLASLTCMALPPGALATEVYKWTDANGKVHFGDRMSAPADGKQIDVKVQPANSPVPEQRDAPKLTPPPAPVMQPPGKTKSKPVDPSRVRAGCQDLIEQISKVKPGTNWESLYQRFDATCPGIAYECTTYRTHPENNRCTWVERTGGNVLHTSSYE